jgi:hypothetical protein
MDEGLYEAGVALNTGDADLPAVGRFVMMIMINAKGHIDIKPL